MEEEEEPGTARGGGDTPRGVPTEQALKGNTKTEGGAETEMKNFEADVEAKMPGNDKQALDTGLSVKPADKK